MKSYVFLNWQAKNYLLFTLAIVSMLSLAACGKSTEEPASVPSKDPAVLLEAELETLRQRYNLPSLAVFIGDATDTLANSAVGVRKLGNDTAVTAGDLYHLGSVTKSMTATLAALLVEQGKISWQSKPVELFPELATSIHADFKELTLEQLLANRGGIVNLDKNPELAEQLVRAFEAQLGPTDSLRQQRQLITQLLLAQAAEFAPGSEYDYSNFGYVIAGAMLEQAANKQWETLTQELLFQPLGITTAGFGPPASSGSIDQPWGHFFDGSEAQPIAPDAPNADNPAFLGPAGTVHMSLADLGRYTTMHLQAGRGSTQFLSKASQQMLYTPRSEDGYALGLIFVPAEGTDDSSLLWHNGSNTNFYVTMYIFPEENRTVIVGTNMGAAAADAGFLEISIQETAEMLLTRYEIEQAN
ncbi:MAG: serine hydrolase domain-containing protein [Deinococcota bacterium]